MILHCPAEMQNKIIDVVVVAEFNFKAQVCIEKGIDLLKGRVAPLCPLDVLVHDLGVERSCTSTEQLNFPVFNYVIPLAQFCFLL